MSDFIYPQIPEEVLEYQRELTRLLELACGCNQIVLDSKHDNRTATAVAAAQRKG